MRSYLYGAAGYDVGDHRSGRPGACLLWSRGQLLAGAAGRQRRSGGGAADGMMRRSNRSRLRFSSCFQEGIAPGSAVDREVTAVTRGPSWLLPAPPPPGLRAAAASRMPRGKRHKPEGLQRPGKPGVAHISISKFIASCILENVPGSPDLPRLGCADAFRAAG